MDNDTARPRAVTQRRQRRRIGPVLALGLLMTIGPLATACGGDPSLPGVAGASGTTTSRPSPTSRAPSGSPATTSPSSTSPSTSTPPGLPASDSEAATQAQELQLAQCMRSHGVSNFPDPSANRTELQNIARAGIDTRSPTYTAALQACRQYTQAGNLTPAQRAADDSVGVEISQCMRSHGVPNFPDPTTGPLGEQAINLGPEHIDPTSPAYQAASQACQRIVPGSK